MDEVEQPSPTLDGDTFRLTQEVLKVTELLAENTHNAWARERMHQGWKFGPTRDEAGKINPSLVPYKDLPEEEKEINRNAALDTIKALFSLTHVQQNEQVKAFITSPTEMAEKSAVIIGQIKDQTLTVAKMRHLWVDRVPALWMRNVDIYRRAVDACLRLGEAFMGFDISVEGLATFPGDLRLIQLQALALARTGATRQANLILQELRSSGHQDEETLGLLARTYKDFWMISTGPFEKLGYLDSSFELYAESYRHNRGYYSGINAAAMGLLAGRTAKAKGLAGEVAGICEEALRKSPESTEKYWLLSTLAEAALILGDLETAKVNYKKACACGQGWSVINRTRTQARLLLEQSGHPTSFLDECFPAPRIVVASGHMFDKPDRANPRFPADYGEAVRAEMDHRLAKLGAQVGFCSLACGADMIFAEAMLARGGEIHIVLPFQIEDFIKASVDIIPGLDFRERFEHILESAATVTTLNESAVSDDGAVYEYCNLALIGLGLLKGQFLSVDVVPLAVWDGQAGDGRGGTESFIRHWEKNGIHVEIIQLERVQNTPPPQSDAPAAPPGEPVLGQEIKAMCFADIVGFTKLTETQIPAFAAHFMARVAELLASLTTPPTVKNTWGDAIYCVFDDVASAGNFAIQLRSLVLETDWTQYGLRKDLSIRIALHAGPAYPVFDPVLKQLTFLGSHVNRAARIEPIAEEGQIYASQAFAALVAAQGVQELVCDYVGQKQLAKSFGAFPVFLVRAATGLETTFFYRNK